MLCLHHKCVSNNGYQEENTIHNIFISHIRLSQQAKTSIIIQQVNTYKARIIQAICLISIE